ncbi:MAG: hypothetical protein AAF205_12475, partial [Pseudomonadota bacterium]
MKRIGGLLAALLGLAVAAVAGWHVADRAPAAADVAAEAEPFDLSRLLVLVDADMAATGYADGRLHPIDGAADVLVTIDGLGADGPQLR